MNSDKPKLYPIHLLESIVKQFEMNTIDEMVFNVNTFHRLVNEIKPNFKMDFGYADLIEYSERFSIPHQMFVEEYELHIHKTAIDNFKKQADLYRRMISPLSDIESIVETLQKLR